jgi:hypothetical protein
LDFVITFSFSQNKVVSFCTISNPGGLAPVFMSPRDRGPNYTPPPPPPQALRSFFVAFYDSQG